jgi:hypothetical protein
MLGEVIQSTSAYMRHSCDEIEAPEAEECFTPFLLHNTLRAVNHPDIRIRSETGDVIHISVSDVAEDW